MVGGKRIPRVVRGIARMKRNMGCFYQDHYIVFLQLRQHPDHCLLKRERLEQFSNLVDQSNHQETKLFPKTLEGRTRKTTRFLRLDSSTDENGVNGEKR
jgi:hypothetical protein